jgi:spermidine synthase
VLFQDGLIFLADTGNEALFEMYTHIPMQTGRVKKNVLLIGAGDGYGVKHLLDYPTVEKVVAIDIDREFVELSKKVYPEVSWIFNDPRVDFQVIDGAEYLKNTTDKFDVIIITVGDPFTVSKSMFNLEFVKIVTNIWLKMVFKYGWIYALHTHEETLNIGKSFK